MNLNELYSVAHDITEQMSTTNKYTFIGYNKILPVKYLDINDILKHDLPIKHYIQNFGTVLLFPNIVDNNIEDLYVRPLNTKESPLKLGNNKVLYNLGNFKNFKYGNPIILVEGIADLAGLKLIVPNAYIVAMQSSSIPIDYYEILAGLTNKIIIVADNDKAGLNNAYNMRRNFKQYNVDVAIVKQYSSYKDTGDIVDSVIKYTITRDAYVKKELEIAKEYYKLVLSSNGVNT